MPTHAAASAALIAVPIAAPIVVLVAPALPAAAGHGSYTTHTAVFGSGEPVIRCATSMGDVITD